MSWRTIILLGEQYLRYIRDMLKYVLLLALIDTIPSLEFLKLGRVSNYLLPVVYFSGHSLGGCCYLQSSLGF